MLMCSIGTWAGAAEGFEMKKEDIGVWFAQTDAALTPEKVIKIEVTKAGGLKAALDELAVILAGENLDESEQEYRTALDAEAQNSTGFIADNRLIVKVVYTGEGSLSLSNDDISALNSLNIPTIDLQDLKPASAFTLSNSNVKNLILPDQWTMAQVQAAATGCSNLNAALSIGTDVGAGVHADGTAVTGIGKSIVAYVNKPGTLYQCTRRLGYMDNNNTKLGNANPYTFALSDLKLVTITGTPSARDFNGVANNGAVKFDADGHLVFDKEADENSVEKDAAVGGGFRQLQGTAMSGALTGANLIKLDLGDAIITDAHCSDLTISWSYSAISTSLKEIVFPTTNQLTTLPADCLNGDYALLEEVCIPGNIKVLKTRACYISTQVLRHIWTTGETEHMVYDNGTYLVSDPDNVDHKGHAPLDDNTWNCGKTPEGAPRYGTITLPEGLTLIESQNFTARSVSDVYVLAQTAPECHVDAFSTIMYLGNNTIDTQYIQQQGMVTRQAYAQSVEKGEYITFLHYPRQCGTPNIQRYTDPTREYSVATTLRDGKGNVIYFPNQSELNRAYLQGTTGYLWYAWDSERVPGPAGNENSFKNVNPSPDLQGHNAQVQAECNGYYTRNTMTDPKKTDRSFYDVRLDDNEQPTLAQPSGLDWYYNTQWEGTYLYPQAESTPVYDDQGQPVMETVPVYDANGNIIYDDAPTGSTYEGNYIRNEVDVFVENENGDYCHSLTSDSNGQWTIGYEYTEDPNGGWVKASWNDQIYIAYESWMSNNPAYANAKRYNRVESGFVPYVNEMGNVPRFNIGDDYVLYSDVTSEYKTLLTRYNKKVGYEYREATSADAGPFYTMRTQQVQEQQVVKANDYRGWHQFVLTAYATNDDRPFTPIKFYQTDNDWWTVCLPYDLKYNDMIKFFGNETTGAIPYLSKLRYVVRDYDKEKITLMFSKNLMEYKEVITNPSLTDDYVHGDIDDVTTWIGEGEGQYASEAALKEANPIILHKGVPYLIRPNIPANANRSFDIYKTTNEDLYKRLNDAQNVDGGALATYIYKGEYTVPAYVIGENIPEAEAPVNSRSFAHAAGPTFTYNSSDKIVYGGEEVTASISSKFSYTFVGSFFLSLLPENCYFLGWDSNKKRATFWYNRVPKSDSYDWNNQTGIICPNFNTSLEIDPATTLSDPAKWTIKTSGENPDIACDDLIGVNYESKTNTEAAMDEGGAIFSVDVVVNGIGKINTDDASDGIERADVIYDLRGVRMNQPLKSLPKGIYIVNGKKYVVK